MARRFDMDNSKFPWTSPLNSVSSQIAGVTATTRTTSANSKGLRAVSSVLYVCSISRWN